MRPGLCPDVGICSLANGVRSGACTPSLTRGAEMQLMCPVKQMMLGGLQPGSWMVHPFLSTALAPWWGAAHRPRCPAAGALSRESSAASSSRQRKAGRVEQAFHADIILGSRFLQEPTIDILLLYKQKYLTEKQL